MLVHATARKSVAFLVGTFNSWVRFHAPFDATQMKPSLTFLARNLTIARLQIEPKAKPIPFRGRAHRPQLQQIGWDALKG